MSGQGGAHRHPRPRLHEDPLHDAVLEDLDFDDPLLRLHGGNDVAALHPVAGFHLPLHQRAASMSAPRLGMRNSAIFYP